MLLSEPMGLDACEDTLRQAVAGTRIVAETALSEKDLNLLTERIRLLFEANPRHAVSLLERDYPSAFLCFMAWKAKTSYSEGVFWPPILESLGLSGARWEKELGLAFQRCLAKTGLPQYEVPGALPYVTPVLLHGGIPDSCLDSFFRQVVDPLVRDGMVDFGAIEHEVKTLRKEDESYRKYEAQEKALRSELSIAEKVAALCEKLESLKTRCHDRKVLLENTHVRLSGTAKSIWGVPWNPELSEQVKAAGCGRLDVLREAVAERDRVLGELQTSSWLDQDVQDVGEGVWDQVGPYRLRPPYSPKALPVARAAMAISASGAATGVVALRLWQTAGLRLPFIWSRAGLLAAVGVLAAMALASGAWASQIRGKTNRFEKSAQSLREALNAIQAVCPRPVLKLSAADADSLAEACRLIETADELEGGILLTEREIDEVSNEISRIIDENPLFAGGDLQEGLGKLETAISARARVPKLLDELEKAEARLAEQLHLPAFGPTVDEPIARYILLGEDSALEFLQECVSLRCFGRKDSPSESPVSVSPVSAAAVNHARRSYDLWAQMTDRKVEKEPRKDLTGQKEGRSAGLRIDTVDRVGRRREPRERTALPQLPEERAEDSGYERDEKTRSDLVTWAHRGQQHVGLLISGAEVASGCACSVCYSDTREELEYVTKSDAAQWGFTGIESDEMLDMVIRLEALVCSEMQDAGADRVFDLYTDSPLVFKLSGETGSYGRRIRYISEGKYVILCPSRFEVRGNVSRLNCSVKDCRAYTTEVTARSGLPEILLPTGQAYGWEKRQAHLLEGKVLRFPADSRDFFLGKAPVLVSPEPFKEGTTVVIGSEGTGRQRRFFTKLKAMPGETKLDLDDVRGEKGGNTFKKQSYGWFFVRIYEQDEVLLDSLHFVLVRGITQISYPETLLFPGHEGHGALSVFVNHNENVTIQVDRDDAVDVFKQEPSSTVVSIPPDPYYETCNLQIKEGRRSGRLRIPVPVNRLWYAAGSKLTVPVSWDDLPVMLSYDDFLPRKEGAIWLKVPAGYVGTSFFVGFSALGSKKYIVRQTPKGALPIPLEDFYDYPELRSGQVKKMWIWHDDSERSHCLAEVQPQRPVRQYRASGRSKNVHAIARLFRPGDGSLTCDGLPIDEFLRGQRKHAGSELVRRLLQDPVAGDVLGRCSVTVSTYGGRDATVRKCKAAAHSLANVLKEHDPSLAERLENWGLGGARPKRDPPG